MQHGLMYYGSEKRLTNCGETAIMSCGVEQGSMMNANGSDARRNPRLGTDADPKVQLALYREYRSGGKGARQAYERLVGSLTGIAYSIAQSYASKYRVDAEDLAQDALLRGV